MKFECDLSKNRIENVAADLMLMTNRSEVKIARSHESLPLVALVYEGYIEVHCNQSLFAKWKASDVQKLLWLPGLNALVVLEKGKIKLHFSC